MGPLRIVLVDDHEMVLQGLTTILGQFLGRVRVVGQALDADAAQKLASIGGVQVTVEADECALPEHVEIALYRIAQEALQNVVKHAGAAAACVILRCDLGLVSLRVTDDGAGFSPDAAAGGFGLSGMAERAELGRSRGTV